MAGDWVFASVFLATYRARISISFSNSSSSDSDGAVRSSTIYAVAGGFELEACNCTNNFAHLDVPSMSSILFSLLLVVVM